MAQKEKRKKDPEFTTPRGTFVWPKLTEPDYGTDKYKKPDGEYSVKVRFDGSDPAVIALIEKLTPLHEAAVSEGKEKFAELGVKDRKRLKELTVNPLFSEVYDEETEEPTGEIEFKFAMPASGTYKKGAKEGKKWTAAPIIVDAQGVKINKAPNIWGGTIGRISFSARPYWVAGTGMAGLKCRLIGVQIIDLVSSGSRSAESMGFTKEEGGYAHEDEEETVSATSSEAEETEDEGVDF